jgi:hypothetical protein
MVVVPARQATQPDGIGSLESILGILKNLKFGLRPRIELGTYSGGRFRDATPHNNLAAEHQEM